MFDYLSKIISLLFEDKSKLPLMFFLFMVASFIDALSIALLLPFMQVLIDFSSIREYEYIFRFFGLDEKMEIIVFLAISLLIAFLIKAVTSVLVNWQILKISFNRQAIIKESLLRKYLNMPYKEYLQGSSARYIQIIQNVSMQYIKILQALLRLISDGLIFFSIIFVLAWVQGPLLLTAAAFMILLLFLYERFFRQILDQRSRTIVNSSVEVTKTVTESIEGLKEIKILGKEDFFAKNLKFNADLYAKSQILADLIRTQPKHIIELLFVLGFTLSIIFSSSLMNNFQSIVPILGVFLFASIRLIPTLNQMLASVNVLRMGVYPTNLLYDDMHGISDVLQKNNELSNSSKQFTSIELKNIFFSYNQDHSNQINNLNIKVERNKSIGLYGESGSGKTTLVDIMLGLLAPTSGQMFLNLQRVDNLKDFRKHVAYIPQDIFIINDSIKKNIALTNKVEDIDHDLLEDVIKRSRLKEVIKKLPEGMETNIGERGVKLSGGQKQRIAIARALYNKREVLIMDEATSALDNETEREIIEEIKKLKGKITMIVIAHRLTTLQHCDDIYEINSGKISERYSYEDIVKKN